MKRLNSHLYRRVFVSNLYDSNMMFVLLLFCNFLLQSIAPYNLETSQPIIYEVPADDKGDSYFGMSIAIRPKAAFLNNTWTIQIGAPRSGADGNSGSVYRCYTFGPCRIFELHKGLNPFGGIGVYEYNEKKDGAWIGGVMDIKPFGSQERSVVCGHRWMNQNLKNPENIDVTYLMTGVCYLQDLSGGFETPVQRLLPLVNKDKIYNPKPYVADLSTYHWGLGQAGFSVTLSEQYSNLLMGAPGVTHWIGSIIRYDENFDMAVGNFARSEIARKSRYAYLGYSVAFGRFYKDGEVWNVAGAPRSGNYRGQVFIFQFKGTHGDVRIQSSILGATFGEYFGSSLSTGDLNNDGYDDLIAGAPLFSNKNPDEGRIYVYLGTGRGNFLEPAQVINGRVDEGRFGFCITFIKDLDQDGYGDVAVGAPYENDKRGAVYIYRGFSKGLQTDYSQRIGARDVHPHLRGFGVSISPPVDIDGNKFLDMAVGAYLSGHVVLIRSRPIISLYPNIKTENLSLIDRKDSYINVTVCSKFAGSNSPHHVDITRTLEIDPIFGRGTLESGISLSKKIIHLRTNQVFCEVHPIMLNFSKKNFSPLQIVLKNEIQSCRSSKRSLLLIKGQKFKGADEFQKTCPIGKKAEISREILIAGVCGSDVLCTSDLELLCEVPVLRGVSYILGSVEMIVLKINIKNHGEPAYQTKIKVQSNLRLKHFNKNKDSSSDLPKRIHWLDVEGFLSDNYQTNFSFQIDFDALNEAKGETHLSLILEVFTTSLETNLKNNRCKFSVKLVSDTFLDFHASSSTPSAYITKTMLQEQTLKATHYYEVRKTGVTPVKYAELTIYIPYFYKKEILTFDIVTADWIHFSDFYDTTTPVADQCTYRNLMKDSLPDRFWSLHRGYMWGTTLANGLDLLLLLEKKINKENESDELERKNNEENYPSTNRTLFLNCSTPKNNCKVQKIVFTKGIPNGFSFYVKILISLNITAIDLVNTGKDAVLMSTTGVLKFSKFFEEPKELQKSASISLYEEQEWHMKPHVIILSILAGGILLSLIVTVLAKKNFFKRNKKQELRALRDADAFFLYFPTKASPPAT